MLLYIVGEIVLFWFLIVAVNGRHSTSPSYRQIAGDSMRPRRFPQWKLTWLARHVMDHRRNTHIGLVLLLGGLLGGCSTLATPPALESPTLFSPTEQTDPAMLKVLSENQETLLQSCEETKSCDEVHFTRGLLGLFGDRESAAISFRRSMEMNPTGPFAASSARWLEILSNSGPAPSMTSDRTMRNLTEGLVRTWLRHKYLAASKEAPSNGHVVQVLQRRVQDRDKRITELKDQLEALKAIEATRTQKLKK